jgi:hypothetical protein
MADRVPSDLSTILQAMQQKLVNDGLFASTMCWLSLIDQLSPEQFPSSGGKTFALICPKAMLMVDAPFTGGGNLTMAMEGTVSLIIYSQLNLDQPLRANDLLTKKTLGLLALMKGCINSWSQFDPLREDDNRIMREPLRLNQTGTLSIVPPGWGRYPSDWRVSFTQEISYP